MKLERLHESILPTVVLIGGLLLAIFAGSAAGSGRVGTVGLIMGGIFATAFFLIVRHRMWMLIPACWMLSGKISVLPLPFSVAHIALIFAAVTFLLLKAFKVVRVKPKTGIVEFWLIFVLTYLGTVFLRNPVGVEALGSDRVGGRPYFDVCIACVGLWVLARAVATPVQAAVMPLLVVGGHTFSTALNLIANRFPVIVGPMAQLYSGFEAAETQEAGTPYVYADDARKPYLEGFGSSLFLTCCSFWRPLTLINPVNFFRFSLFFTATLAILFSGFRSAFMTMIFTFAVSTYFRRGWREVLFFSAVAAFSLGFIILVQGNILSLPLAVQRSLSFLPGKWDYAAKSEAEGSTEWRVEMWKTMLSGDKYIENKWLGDGFGFTRRQLQIMAANAQTGSNKDQQENLMISGGVHSGPISSIRFVGYVGLAIFLILLVLIARRSVHLIRRAEGTPFYSLSLFLGIPAIWHPVGFIFVFGAYETDLPNAIIMIGLQKMLENSINAFAAQQDQVPADVQIAANRRRASPLAPSISVR